MTEVTEAFSSFAAFYAKGIEFTGSFVEYGLTLMPTIDPSSIIHDNASGPGVAAFIIAKQAQDKHEECPRIYATDLAPGMIEAAKKGIEERKLDGRVTAELLDSSKLEGFEDAMFTHSITNFAIMVIGNDGASEIYRTLKPGGVALVTTWKVSGAALIDRVCERIRPGQPILAPFSKEWEKKETLINVLEKGGFPKDKIEVYAKTDYAQFADVEDLVEYMCNGVWGMWRKGWTEEECGKWEEAVRAELTERNKRECNIEGIAWVAVARK